MAANKPVRVQLKRTKGWRMPPNTVKVDRSTKWGNPFRIGEQYVRDKMAPGGGENCNIVADADHAVDLYKRFTAREKHTLVHGWRKLRGMNLACWCALDAPCHADVLLELANREASDAK